MNNKIGTLLISFAITVGYVLLLIILMSIFSKSPEQNANTIRFLTLLGGSMPSGLIQALTVFAFSFGMLEVRSQLRIIKTENKAYTYPLLPTKESWVISPTEVKDLRMRASEIDQRQRFLLIDLVKKACDKYRSDKSPADSLAVVSEQVKLNLQESESNQSLIRYIAWAIPSIGFIGTVIGIADSLGAAKNVAMEGGIEVITNKLNVAFDTTLVALVFSLVLMYFFHSMQSKMEKLHTHMGSYVIENLINRIYHS